MRSFLADFPVNQGGYLSQYGDASPLALRPLQLGNMFASLDNDTRSDVPNQYVDEMTVARPTAAPMRTRTASPTGSPATVWATDSSVPASGRALLDTISGSESNYPGRDPYRVIYGGGELTDFADHPRRYVPIISGPNQGQSTSAAGRYQYLGRSWDEAKNALNLPDFSPASQDKAAWWDAQRAYRRNTGRDLLTDIDAAGDDEAKLTSIGRGISSWWTSLPGGIEPNRATGSFGSRFATALRRARGQ